MEWLWHSMVLIVAKCIVNEELFEFIKTPEMVLIVAKCIVNFTFEISYI